jgi:uncharacterized metal-binding protein YceD (DUF177 family)
MVAPPVQLGVGSKTMEINLRHIPAEGKRYIGDEPAANLKIENPLYRFDHPIHFELEATLSGKGVLVRGTLNTSVKATCVRTLEPFDLPVIIDDFTVLVEEVPGDIVDLTPQIREDILLELPAHPVNPDAPKEVHLTQETPPAKGSAAWEALEKLKGKLGSGH